MKVCDGVKTEEKPQKLKRILLPAAGIVLAAIAAAAVALQLGGGKALSKAQPDVHSGASAGAALTVNYTKPATTAEEYDRLYAACAQYMDAYSAPEEHGSVVDVTEDLFIDRDADAAAPNRAPRQDEYTEYDRAYFEDFLMVRYVSRSGSICVVGARLDGKTRTEVQLLDQDDFSSEHFSAAEDEAGKWKLWFGAGTKLEGELKETGAVSEETFVSCVGQCILDLMGGMEDDTRLISHFTEEGMASLTRIMQVLEIDPDCTVGIVLAEAGTSEPGLADLDRMYLRCEVLRGTDAAYLNLLIKLNDSMMIYDVDTI